MPRTNLSRRVATGLALLALVAPVAACSSSKSSSSSPSTSGAPPTSAASGSATATTATATARRATVWLCRPGLKDNPCESSLDSTSVSATGAQTAQPASPAKNPPIDCFYVYPTVSEQTTANANLTVDAALTAVAVAQASRFSQVCKVYAPVYRQLTVRAIMTDLRSKADPAIAYADVEAAWKDYLAHDNKGRGVVLIGHSQGSFVLTQLVKKQIDDVPATRKLLVSALLLGGNITVKTGSDVGGSFQHVPACRSTDQTGCVVAYSSFLSEPPTNSLFGRTQAAGQEVLCVNPAGLGGGDGSLQPYLPTHARLLGGIAKTDFNVPTAWVDYPGLFKAHCEDRDGASWLQVDDVRGPGDTRPRLPEQLGPTWGLHLVDVNVAYGNLVALVRAEAAAWHR